MIGTKYDPRVGSCPWFWMWFFGGFYLFYKGLIGHGLVWFLLCWTFIVPVIYIFMARNLVFEKMVKTGQITPNYAMGNVVNVNL